MSRTHAQHVGGATYVNRILDVKKGVLSYVVGTVYMDMPLKPSILDDIAKDVRTVAYQLEHWLTPLIRNGSSLPLHGKSIMVKMIS